MGAPRYQSQQKLSPPTVILSSHFLLEQKVATQGVQGGEAASGQSRQTRARKEFGEWPAHLTLCDLHVTTWELLCSLTSMCLINQHVQSISVSSALLLVFAVVIDKPTPRGPWAPEILSVGCREHGMVGSRSGEGLQGFTWSTGGWH